MHLHMHIEGNVVFGSTPKYIPTVVGSITSKLCQLERILGRAGSGYGISCTQCSGNLDITSKIDLTGNGTWSWFLQEMQEILEQRDWVAMRLAWVPEILEILELVEMLALAVLVLAAGDIAKGQRGRGA